jgi:3-isopropylmalate/(R)-2-methylmalate dehydratase large subunit
MGSTLAEKILARASGQEVVKAGQQVTANIDLVMVHDAMAAILDILARAEVDRIWNCDKVVCLFDHWNPPSTVKDAENHKKIRQAIKKFGIKNFYDGNAGICHQVVVEKGHILPGQLIVGSDSHTPTYGALGAAGVGIGHSEIAYVLATGKLWFRVPPTLKFIIHGRLSPRIAAKDVILHLIGKYSVDVAQYKAVEFSGEVCSRMGLGDRMTMSNMAAEMGAKFAFFEPNEAISNYLRARSDQPFAPIKSDLDSVYENIFSEDVSDLEPQVALPFSPGNVKSVSDIRDVKVDQAVLGSCTNGRLEDLKIATEVMNGRKIHPDVRMLVLPASSEVFREALSQGILQKLVESGATICPPCCGPCMGAHMGLLASGEVCISSTNRNFKGRMGSADSMLYLASPATVAASAVRGKISDCRDF